MHLDEVGWEQGMNRFCPGQVQVTGTCKCGNEHSGSIKYGKILDQVRTGQLLMKDCASWSMETTDVAPQGWDNIIQLSERL